MKKVILGLMVLTGFVMAESCVTSQMSKDYMEEKVYTYKEICIDKNLYIATTDGKDITAISPMVSYVNGVALQTKCECKMLIKETLSRK